MYRVTTLRVRTEGPPRGQSRQPQESLPRGPKSMPSTARSCRRSSHATSRPLTSTGFKDLVRVFNHAIIRPPDVRGSTRVVSWVLRTIPARATASPPRVDPGDLRCGSRDPDFSRTRWVVLRCEFRIPRGPRGGHGSGPVLRGGRSPRPPPPPPPPDGAADRFRGPFIRDR